MACLAPARPGAAPPPARLRPLAARRRATARWLVSPFWWRGPAGRCRTDRFSAGEVEPDVVLEQTRFLHSRRVDHHRRVAGPVCCLRHRVVEALDRGGDSPHDRHRRDAVGAVDEPLHYGGLLGPVARVRRLHASVGLVKDEVQGEVLVDDGVRQRVPHRERPRVRHRQVILRFLLRSLGRSPDQKRLLPQLLGVEEVDLARFKLLLVEGVLDHNQARVGDPVGGV